MIFSSVTFLFLFLPLVLAGYCVSGKQYRNHTLFGASLVFYLWGEGGYTVLLLCSIFLTYIFGLQIENADNTGKRSVYLWLGIACNLLPLFVFKYLHFTLSSLAPAFFSIGTQFSYIENLHLPAGISFFTFQAISYLIDVHRRVAPAEKRLLDCGLYISMFPQLIAGPIVRYHDISRQLKERMVTVPSFAYGVERFVFGLSKKALLADPLGSRADQLFTVPVQELGVGNSWLGAVCFSLQIYYDFSGYSDMAIGLGRMFGFSLPENFNYPYVSRSIKEFWRRWHISLSAWLRDYLYIPLGGNRKGSGRTMINLLIVFLLCGLWHGANWTFVVWGLWHGTFLVLERLVPLEQKKGWQQCLGWLYATTVVVIGWVVFRSPSLTAAWDYLAAMSGLVGQGNEAFGSILGGDRLFLTELVAGLIIASPVYALLKRAMVQTSSLNSTYITTCAVALIRIGLFSSLLYFVLITIASRAYHPFLYFQF